MDKPTYNDLRSLLRIKAHQLVDLLRDIKRIHRAVDGVVTSRDLLLSRVTVPDGYVLGDDGILKDGDGNIVADYSLQKYECDALLSALAGLRAAIALLENDESFLQRGGIIGVNHWAFIEMLMDWEKRGGL